ncbi:MAG TPA: hypothetical protein VM818_00225 [Vicinamibacterales bacterium]|nr:hypothetical protein [Vicinamibacterales bacterium]
MDDGRSRRSTGRLTPSIAVTQTLGSLIARLLLVASFSALALWPSDAGAQIFESIGIRAQGMSGAFVAVSNDATTTWWNPAGLAHGGFFNTILEFDRDEDSGDSRASAFALTVPSLGFSYYRLSLSGMRPALPTGSDPSDREDEGALSQFGVTVGQSIGSHLVVASTLKLVNALGETSGDLDMGVMLAAEHIRLGLAARNLRTAEFSDGVRRLELPLQVRTGVSFTAVTAPRFEALVAVDGDLTTTPTAFGDARHLAAGAEAWLLNRTIGVRGGVGFNTIGETRRSGSVGASVAFRSGLYADAHLTRGDDEVRNGWGFAVRVTF